MKEIVIISGKGGTGKTSITAAFASLAKDVVVVDCDVDAADLYLILQPEIQESHTFIGGKTAQLDSDKCLNCSKCEELCRFNAISCNESCTIDEMACEGCGVCAYLCPSGAITMKDCVNGNWFVSQTRVGPLVHAKLNAGGENSGKLVTQIRNRAREVAESTKAKLILTDGPPGIGCPVIASLAAADDVVIATEPTASGIHDLQRVAELAAHFNISASVIINKADVNYNKAEEIESYARDHHLTVLGRIPYDPVFTKAQLSGKSVVEFADNPVTGELKKIWNLLSI